MVLAAVGPRMRPRPRTETARRGEAVTLRCAADGDPPLDISWRLRGNRIDPAFDARLVSDCRRELADSCAGWAGLGCKPDRRGWRLARLGACPLPPLRWWSSLSQVADSVASFQVSSDYPTEEPT